MLLTESFSSSSPLWNGRGSLWGEGEEEEEKNERSRMGRKKRREMGFGGETWEGIFHGKVSDPKKKKTGDHKFGGNQAKKRAKIFGKSSYCRLYYVWFFFPNWKYWHRFPTSEISRFDPSTSIMQSGFGREKEGMEAATARAHKNSWMGRSERK